MITATSRMAGKGGCLDTYGGCKGRQNWESGSFWQTPKGERVVVERGGPPSEQEAKRSACVGN